MYTPTHYRENNENLAIEVMKNFSFATLISATPDGPFISHLPVLIDPDKKTLLSHCARANPHWKYFNNNNPVTVVFTGPHSYISPAWYEPDPGNVPTWNYVAVHVKGTARIIEDIDASWTMMNKLVQHYEKYNKTSWNLPESPNEILKNDLHRGITVFEININHIESKFKLSQNQSSIDRNSIIENLSHGTSEQGRVLAEYMKKVIK